MARGKKQEEEVVTEEIIQQAMSDAPAPEPKKSKAFETVLNDFNENEGWIHVKLKKDDKSTSVKIGKFRPAEFDKDEIARQYGGGIYYYDLRDKLGQRVATDEERYADNLMTKNGNPTDTGLTQALSLIKDLASEISKIKQDIAKPQPQPVIQEPKEDKKYELMIEMMKQQSQQNTDMIKALLTAQANNQPKEDKMGDFLQMLQAVKNLIPQPQPVEKEEKPSMAEAVELASVLADLKDNGNTSNNQSLVDVVKTFLTDGSLANVIAMLKPKPMIPAMQQNQSIKPTSNNQQAIPQNTQINQNQHQAMPEQAEPEQSATVMLTFFQQYESTLFNMKVNGSDANYLGETICNLTNLQPEFKTIAYMFFEDSKVACEKLFNVAKLFKNDRQFLQEVCDYIHSYFYDIETDEAVEEPEQESVTENVEQAK